MRTGVDTNGCQNDPVTSKNSGRREFAEIRNLTSTSASVATMDTDTSTIDLPFV